ncbi:hypothetical protein BU14_0164s0027 [Porphyra umbilicalis]|uniref:Uncharacterized protein n=1 Tax=Porphyra umbilicalis TaxID=2786 RepID=A0A1X6P8B2_PORUM|nr:hypothetical protein BU14_0164s0027 [Porphyra umbilicalis]|eukprot:OSX77067.1 hypothetical protein BU14_0164s0027 [Porphyra umbilicalis]
MRETRHRPRAVGPPPHRRLRPPLALLPPPPPALPPLPPRTPPHTPHPPLHARAQQGRRAPPPVLHGGGPPPRFLYADAHCARSVPLHGAVRHAPPAARHGRHAARHRAAGRHRPRPRRLPGRPVADGRRPRRPRRLFPRVGGDRVALERGRVAGVGQAAARRPRAARRRLCDALPAPAESARLVRPPHCRRGARRGGGGRARPRLARRHARVGLEAT